VFAWHATPVMFYPSLVPQLEAFAMRADPLPVWPSLVRPFAARVLVAIVADWRPGAAVEAATGASPLRRAIGIGESYATGPPKYARNTRSHSSAGPIHWLWSGAIS
jgi:hypothetical protein